MRFRVYLDCACLSVVLVLGVCSSCQTLVFGYGSWNVWFFAPGLAATCLYVVLVARAFSAMSYGGESFSPDDAYDSSLDSVLPVKGKYTINASFSTKTVRFALSCGG